MFIASPLLADRCHFGRIAAHRIVALLGVKPLELGNSRAQTKGRQVLAIGNGRNGSVLGAYVGSPHEFAGRWASLLSEAIFTAPPHMEHNRVR